MKQHEKAYLLAETTYLHRNKVCVWICKPSYQLTNNIFLQGRTCVLGC